MGGRMNAPCRFLLLCLLLLTLLCRFQASAAVAVNPPLAITHRVEVQPIRVRTVDGAVATTLGTAEEETYIKEQINRIWAQAGVRIEWLPVVDYTSNFAYNGAPGVYQSSARPIGEFNTIVGNAPSPPASASATVLNMFFVEIVPGFQLLGEYNASGLGFVDDNGVTVYVGRNLLGFEGGRDVIASVIAHEIGHNLGLSHVNTPDNLMASGGSEERLTAEQKAKIFTNNSGVDGYDLLRPWTSHYRRWATASGVSGNSAGDDDRDGISNVIEFMFNLNPKAASVLPQPVLSAEGLTWSLPKSQLALDDGLVYQVQVSDSLQSWAAAGAQGSGSTVVENSTAVLAVRLNAGAAQRYMRLNIVVPQGL